MNTHKLYNNKITLLFDPVKHLYYRDTVDESTIVLSVTGLISVIAKPALIQWSANQAADKFKELVKPGEALDEVLIEDYHTRIRYAHRARTQAAATVGKLAHEWIEQWIKGKKPTMPVNKEVKASVGAFLAWVKKHKVKFIASEEKVYSVKHNFAGTMDFEAEVDGMLLVGDLKTSGAIWPEMRFQTVGYQIARQEEFPDKKYDGRLIVRIGKELNTDGSPDFEIKLLLEFDEDSKAFLGALEIRKRLNAIKDEEKK